MIIQNGGHPAASKRPVTLSFTRPSHMNTAASVRDNRCEELQCDHLRMSPARKRTITDF